MSYAHSILGDFEPLNFCVRVFAPSPDALRRYLSDHPIGDPSEWQARVSSTNWEDEETRLHLLYVSNFVHEASHFFQFTTRAQTAQHSFLRRLALAETWKLLDQLRSEGKWPPRLPLWRWLRSFGEHYEHWLKVQLTWQVVERLFDGDEGFAAEYFAKGDGPQCVVPKPFNPRVGHITSGTDFDAVPITTRLLLESEATLLEYRFMASHFGDILGTKIWGLLSGGGLRTNYDILPIVAIRDGMQYLLPFIIDWTFQGDITTAGPRYADIHPPWRFASLYRAAKELFAGIAPGEIVTRHEEIVDAVHKTAQLEVLGPAVMKSSIDWVQRELSGAERAIVDSNMTLRFTHPTLFGLFELNYDTILANARMPIVIFGANLLGRHSFGKPLGPLEAVQLSYQGRRFFELQRMISSAQIACPFCNPEVVLIDGKEHLSRDPFFVNAGAAGRITEDLLISNRCGCAWAFEFKEAWGVSPDALEIEEDGTFEDTRSMGSRS